MDEPWTRAQANLGPDKYAHDPRSSPVQPESNNLCAVYDFTMHENHPCTINENIAQSNYFPDAREDVQNYNLAQHEINYGSGGFGEYDESNFIIF